MEFLDKIVGFFGSIQGSIATIAVVVEFALRMIPSQKPLSILHVVGAVAKKLGQAFTAMGDFMDKILPQVTIEPKV